MRNIVLTAKEVKGDFAFHREIFLRANSVGYDRHRKRTLVQAPPTMPANASIAASNIARRRLSASASSMSVSTMRRSSP